MGLKTFFRVGVASLALLLATEGLAQTLPTTTITGSAARSQLPQSLPDIAPETIARDSRTTIIEGRAIVTAPTFDPFELEDSVAGSASLRSSRGEISRDGNALPDGAVLDLAMIYTAGTNDPYDVRGLDQAVFLSGEPIPSVRYDTRVLECSSRVTDVVYRDDYYAGVSHGLIGGLFLAYPRYRGHRNYGYHYDRDRRAYGRRGRGYSSYGNRRTRGRVSDGRPGRDYSSRDGRRDGRRDGGRTGRNDNSHDGVTTTPRNTRRRSPGGTRRGLGVGRQRGVLPDSPRAIANTDRPNTDRRREGRRAEGRRNEGRRNDTRRTPLTSGRERAPERTTLERVPSGISTGRNTRQNGRNRDTYRAPPEGRRSEPSIAPPRSSDRNAGRNSGPKRSIPSGTIKYSAPKQDSAPRRSSSPKKSSKKSQSRSRSTPKSVDRAADRAFSGGKKGRSRGGKRGLDYYPSQVRVDSYEDRRCAKEETLGLFIPRERLDAARFDGLTILVLGRDGAELPVFLPPNYIEGFRQASGVRVSTTYRQ